MQSEGGVLMVELVPSLEEAAGSLSVRKGHVRTQQESRCPQAEVDFTEQICWHLDLGISQPPEL